MENDILYELIDRYLEGDLSVKERRDVESRMAADPDFRAEVAMHRAIQAHLGDRGELRLRAALEKMRAGMEDSTDEPVRKPGLSFGVWQRYVAIAVALALLFAAWWWLRPVPEQPPVPDQPALPKPTSPDIVPDTPPQQPTLPETPADPIAMADPADLIPNPTLEARLGSVRGGAADDVPIVDISRPAIGAEISLKNGLANLRIRGTVSADTLPANRPLVLSVYSNRPGDWDAKRPLRTFPIPVNPAGQGSFAIDSGQSLRLKPGLYYLVVAQQRLPEDGGDYRTLWVGKVNLKVKM